MFAVGRLGQAGKQAKHLISRALATTAQVQGQKGKPPSYFADKDFAQPPPVKPWGREWVDEGWPQDGTGFKDYPNWSEWSHQDRDPTAKYWDQQQRRHFGEPIHFYDDGLRHSIFDSPDHKKYTPGQNMGQMAVCFGILGLMLYYDMYVYDVASHEADIALPKPYAYNNLYLESGGNPAKEPDNWDLTREHNKTWYRYW